MAEEATAVGESFDTDWAAAAEAAKAFEEKHGSPDAPAPGSEKEKALDELKGQGDKPAKPKAKAPVSEVKGDAEDTEGVAGAPVSPSERVKWREQKRQEREKLNAWVEERRAEVAQFESDAQRKFEKYLKAEEALKKGDWDGYAQALHGQNWNDFQKDRLREAQSPEARRIAELEKRERDREAEYQKRLETESREAEQRQQLDERRRYLEGLSSDLESSEDETVAHGAKDAGFIQAVFEEQQKYWDGSETIPTEEAAQAVVERIRADPKQIERLRGQMLFLQAILGDQAASQPETAPRSGKASAKPGGKRPPKTVSQQQALEVSSQDDSDELDESAWHARWGKELAQSDPH